MPPRPLTLEEDSPLATARTFYRIVVAFHSTEWRPESAGRRW